MALENCASAIKDAIGRPLTPAERAAIGQRAKSVLGRLERANGDPQRIAAIMDELGSRGDALVARQRAVAAMQLEKEQELTMARRAEPAAGADPARYWQALLRGGPFNYKGIKNSLAVDVQREGNARADGLLAELQKAGVHDIADSTKIAVKAQIVGALRDLRSGKTLADVREKYGKAAADVAGIFERHSQLAANDINDYDPVVGYNPERAFRRTFDPNKIAKAGGHPYGSNAARDFWAAEQVARTDWEKAFDGDFADATDKARTDVFRKDFGEHVSGQHVDLDREAGRPGVASRFGYRRKYVFKDAGGDLEFNEQYGKGTTLLENRMTEMREAGKTVALMRRFGPKPLEMARRVGKVWVDELNDTDPRKAKALAAKMQNEERNTWNLLTGSLGHPSDDFLMRFEAAARHTIGVAKTGLSIFSLPTDMALNAASMARYSSDRFRGSIALQIKHMADIATKFSKTDRQFVMAQMGSRWEDATRPMDPNLLDHPGWGAYHKWLGYVANTLGHAAWDNTHRVGSMVNDAAIMARDMKQPWDKVSYQKGLSMFGVGKKDWDVLRQAEPDNMSDGRAGLMPLHITKMPLEKFKPLVASDAPSDSALRRARADLAAKYRNFLGERADRSTVATSMENQAALGMGHINPNSPMAIPIRWVTQFKNWPLNYIRNHLDDELRGNYKEPVSVGQAMRDMVLGRNNRALTGMSRMIAKGMVIAYVTNAMRQLAEGETPDNPFDFQTGRAKGGFMGTPGAQAAVSAFAKQGLGLYTDWLANGNWKNATVEQKAFDMLGPMAGEVASIGDLGIRATVAATKRAGMSQKQKNEDSQQLFNLGWRLLPGTQAWYSKAALDALIYNNISETLNPGYKARLQKRAMAKGYQHWNMQQ